MKKGHRFLIIDDEPAFRVLNAELLKSEFPRCTICEVGHSAELDEALEKGDFDLVITDYRLPWITGLEILRRVKKHYPDMPVIMCTGSASEEVAVEAMKAGLSDYIIKSPAHMKRITAAATTALENVRVQRGKKAAEQALFESEKRYRALAENTGDILYYIAADGVINYVSPQVERYGFTPNDFIGREVISIVVPEDRDLIRSDFAEKLATGREYPTVFRIRDGDGGIVWFESKGRVQRSENGDVAGIAGILRDITEKKQAEKELEKYKNHLEELVAERTADLEDTKRRVQESEERYRELFENSIHGIYRTTPFGKIVMANPALVSMLGFSSFEELAQRNLDRNGFSTNFPRSDFKRKLERTGELIGYESAWHRKDGSLVFIRENAKVIRDEKGRTLYFEGTVEDISESRRLEEEILKISSREQRKISFDLHDGLGQQLTGLSFMLKALEQKLATGGRPEAAEAACLSQAIKEMVGSTRALSQGLCPVEIDELGLMASLEKLAAQTEGRYNVACRFDCDTEVKFGDTDMATHLYRIAKEAVINAVKHGKSQTVTICLEATRGGINLIIADDGVGVSPPVATTDGLGVRIMQYRANVIGAAFSIRPGDTAGTVVTCSLPGHVQDQLLAAT